MRGYAVVFTTVFLAELGDKTQLATLLFAANPAASKPAVFAAAATALILSTLIAVVLGDRLGQWVPAGTLKLLAGAGFIAIGTWLLITR